MTTGGITVHVVQSIVLPSCCSWLNYLNTSKLLEIITSLAKEVMVLVGLVCLSACLSFCK